MVFLWNLFVWAIMVYLVGCVAYNEGRKSKWEEMSREYICIHKSVCIKETKIKKEKTIKNPLKKRGAKLDKTRKKR